MVIVDSPKPKRRPKGKDGQHQEAPVDDGQTKRGVNQVAKVAFL
ncbi:hypothetical protein RvY_09750 [Ramazzottius varieornatus]|uniref:Uncharacterized protein n=1 Tax=Ramazzottius varieornatus TaxID=947166 RepID=A0A1D1VAG1_RAMVA|nr:hypothetical protein RvY_09750 [Ramazzottius varieornatus]